MADDRHAECLKRIEEKLDKCVTALEGSPGQPETGFTIRVDRLEQRSKSHTYWLRGMIGVSVAAILEFVVSFLWGKH